MKCPNCSEEVFPGSTFCSNCGASLLDTEAVPDNSDAMHKAETVVGAPVPFFLVVVTGPDANRKIPLEENDLRIGREKDNDLVLTDPRLSRHHAVIARKAGQYEIEDLASANGVFVNGIRITNRQTLLEGDALKLGDTELMFTQSPAISQMLDTSDPTISMQDETPVKPQPVVDDATRESATPPAPPPPPPPAMDIGQPDTLNDQTSPRQQPALAPAPRKKDGATKWLVISCAGIIVLLIILVCLLFFFSPSVLQLR